ncbi:MAG: 30S ribosomal protein S16 [bacterium]
MLMIRMQRIGRRNEAHFRIVLTDHKNAAKSGKFQEILGAYNPKAGEVTIKEDRVKHWMSVGAQPSDTVYNFLVTKGIVVGKKKNVLSRKAPTKKRKELKAA